MCVATQIKSVLHSSLDLAYTIYCLLLQLFSTKVWQIRKNSQCLYEIFFFLNAFVLFLNSKVYVVEWCNSMTRISILKDFRGVSTRDMNLCCKGLKPVCIYLEWLSCLSGDLHNHIFRQNLHFPIAYSLKSI